MKNTKIKLHTLLLAVAVTATLFGVGCKKDDPMTEQENITKVVVHIKGVGTTFDQQFAASDSDHDGIFNTIQDIVLPPNSAFSTEILVYDETKTPVDDLTEEIKLENKVHLFEYKPATTGLVINGLNTDDDGKPFGRQSNWATTVATTGTVQIRLHHEPTDKNAADPGGEIDFEVTFPVKVQ